MTTTAVREKPILFSGSMVKAVLEGRKTQTRRVVKPQPNWSGKIECDWYHPTVIRRGQESPGERRFGFSSEDEDCPCPYGGPGDRLWMRSAYNVRYDESRNETHWTAEGKWVTTHGRPTRRDGKLMQCGKKPGMHMPYWLSVEQWPELLVTGIRVERLASISEEDAIAEGVTPETRAIPAEWSSRPAGLAFYRLWHSIHAEVSPWESSPFVWVIEFRRIEP